MKYIITLLLLPLSSCVVTTRRAYNVEKETWQSIGKMNATNEYLQYIINVQQQRINELSKIEKPKEKSNEPNK